MNEVPLYSFAYTRALLQAWGVWSWYRAGGYPIASAHVPKIPGRNEPPEGVLAVDIAIADVARSEHHLYLRLKTHYHRDCALRQILRILAISARRYYQNLEEAQYAVHVRLHTLEQNATSSGEVVLPSPAPLNPLGDSHGG